MSSKTLLNYPAVAINPFFVAHHLLFTFNLLYVYLLRFYVKANLQINILRNSQLELVRVAFSLHVKPWYTINEDVRGFLDPQRDVHIFINEMMGIDDQSNDTKQGNWLLV